MQLVNVAHDPITFEPIIKPELPTSRLHIDAKDFKPGPTSLGAAVFALAAIVPRIPEDVKNLLNTYKAVGAYAKENKIAAPKDDPTKDLGSLV